MITQSSPLASTPGAGKSPEMTLFLIAITLLTFTSHLQAPLLCWLVPVVCGQPADPGQPLLHVGLRLCQLLFLQ